MITTLTLGQITFATYEIPPQINFGGSQALSVKQLVGGQRVIDSMGRVDDDISWSGLFFGSTATFRAKYLDNMRVTGAPLTLTWGQFSYSVVIKSFQALFQRTYQIPYKIVVSVIQDLSIPFPVLLPVGYDDAIQALLTEANDLALLINQANVTTAMLAVTESINLLPSLANATDSQLATVLAPIINAQSVVAQTISVISAGTFI
jgi:hypothetical protein